MIYAAILAGGVGKRMGETKPKQYIKIGDKPIVIHTIEKFTMVKEFEKILVLCPEDWIEHTQDLIENYLEPICWDKIVVLKGGETRNDTIYNSLKYIEASNHMDEETIIVTHDAARPFVTYRIIMDNIEAAKAYGACDTVIQATDTIVESLDGDTINDIPNRSKLYQGQTPQSFKALKLKQLYENLTPEEKEILTDAAKIFVIRKESVKMVKGSPVNLKITHPIDLEVAEGLINLGAHNA